MKSARMAQCLVAALLFVATAGCNAQESEDFARNVWVELNESDWKAQRDRISAECEQPNLPAWAGTYYCGDGLGLNITFHVSPAAGVAYSWTGCMGIYDLNFGTIREVKEDRLIVDFVRDPRQSGEIYDRGVRSAFLSNELVFVNWGERRYLIPTAQMIKFCNDVNSGAVRYGAFPRAVRLSAEGRILRDTSEVPAGLPPIPAEFREYLLEHPLSATVVSVDRPDEFVEYKDGPRIRKVRVTVDRGADAGWRKGMRMRLPKRNFVGHVVEVTPTSATVELRGTIEPNSSMPSAGDVVST